MTTRTGSMDGRMKDTSTYRRYPPERVIIQDLSADFNLNREMADKFCIPTLLDNIHKFESLQETRKPSGTPPYHDPEEDVYRAKIVQGNVKMVNIRVGFFVEIFRLKAILYEKSIAVNNPQSLSLIEFKMRFRSFRKFAFDEAG